MSNKNRIWFVIVLLVLVICIPSVSADPPVSGDWIITGSETYANTQFILQGNVAVRPGGSLTLDNVTMRMNQFTDGQYGITVDSGSTLSLLNGTIIQTNVSATRYTFSVSGSLIMHDSMIRDIKESLNINSINDSVTKFDRILMERSAVTNNGGYGVSITHVWNEQPYTSNIVIRDCVFSLNGWDGIYLSYTDAQIINTTSRQNGRAGILMDHSSPRITGSTIRDNAERGVYARSSSAPFIADTLITRNSGESIRVESSSAPTIERNYIYNNGNGVMVYDSSINVFNSTVLDGTSGIYLQQSTAEIQGSKITGHTQNIQSGSYWGSVVIRDSDVSGASSWDLYMDDYSWASFTVINATFDPAKVYFRDQNSVLTQKWRLNISVVDTGSQPVNNATVKVYDQLNGLVYTNFTDASGRIPLLEVTKLKKNSLTTAYTTPIIIAVNNATNSTYVTDDLNSDHNVVVTLQGNTHPFIFSGDITLDTTLVLKDTTLLVSGNIDILQNGKLILDNTTLMIGSFTDGQRGITVERGGNLTLINESILRPKDSNLRFTTNIHGSFLVRDSKISGVSGSINIDSLNDGVTRFDDVLIERGNITANTNYGIAISHVWNEQPYTSNIIIRDSIFTLNGWDGIYLSYTDVQLMNTTSRQNGRAGILMDHSSPKITGNTLRDNGERGILLRSSSAPYIADTLITHNGGESIRVESSSAPTVERNDIYSNGNGVFVYDSSINVFNSTVLDGGSGIYLQQSTAEIQGSKITGHTQNIQSGSYWGTAVIRDSDVSGAGSWDLYMDDYSWASFTVINATYNPTKVYFRDQNSVLTQKWRLDISVIDTSSRPVTNATVRVYDQANGLIYTGFTDAAGKVPQVAATERIQNSLTTSYATPIIIAVNNATNSTYVTDNLINDHAVVVTLKGNTAPDVPGGDFIVTGTVVLRDTVRNNPSNVIIRSGGQLILDNTTLMIDSFTDAQRGITVERGGNLTLINGSILRPKDTSLKFTANIHGSLLVRDSKITGVSGSINIDSLNDGVTRFDTILIERGNITSNTNYGVSFTHAWNEQPYTSNIFIRDSIFNLNGWDGIYLSYTDAQLVNTTSRQNGRAGILMDHSSPKITGNTLRDNGDRGILLRSSSAPYITDTLITHNGGESIRVESSSAPTVERNDIYGNGNGIMVYDSSINVFNSTVLDGGSGIYLQQSTSEIRGSKITGHTQNIQSGSYWGSAVIRDSDVSGAGSWDLYMDDYSWASFVVINATFDPAKIYFRDQNSVLTQKWRLDISVIDTSSRPVTNATVKVYDQASGLISTALTDISGKVPQVTATKLVRNSQTTSYATPIIIAVSNATNSTYVTDSLDSDRSVVVTLQGNTVPDIQGGDLIVTNTTVLRDTSRLLPNNVIVRSGGKLILDNTTFMIDCFTDGQRGITVERGGNLTLINGSILRPKDTSLRFTANIHGSFLVRDSKISGVSGSINIDSLNDGVTRFDTILIERGNITSNTNYGVSITHVWNEQPYTSNILIRDSIFTLNGWDGIYLSYSDVQLMNTTSRQNGRAGILMDQSSPKITGNTFRDNGDRGILLRSSSAPYIADTLITRNGGESIRVESSSAPTVERNDIYGNGNGVFVYDSSINVFNSTVLDGTSGIYLQQSTSEIRGSKITGHTQNIQSDSYWGSAVIRDSDVSGAGSWDLYMNDYSWATFTVINVTFDPGKVYFRNQNTVLSSSWFMNVKTVDTNGTRIAGSNVRIVNNLANEVLNTTTDWQGKVPQQLLPQQERNSDATIPKSPYNITATYRNVTTFQKVTLDANKDIIITIPLTAKKGDINGDGNVTAVDALMALKMAVGSYPINYIGDVNGPGYNGDGRLTSVDALIILKVAVGSIVI